MNRAVRAREQAEPISQTEQAITILTQLIETASMPHQGPGLSYVNCKQAFALLAQKATILDAIQSSAAQQDEQESATVVRGELVD